MKNIKNYSLSAILLLLLAGLSSAAFERSPAGRTFYLDAESGIDRNSGKTPEKAWRSLARLNDIELKPGDRILLRKGSRFEGSLVVRGVKGSSEQPITISTYGSGDLPAFVEAEGKLQAILLENCSHIVVRNLSLTASKSPSDTTITQEAAMRCGVLLRATSTENMEGIYLSNLSIRNLFFEHAGFSRPKGEVRSANGTQNYGWGIRVINDSKGAVIRDLAIDSCRIENVGHTGIKLTSTQRDGYGITGFRISGNRVERTGGPGIQMSRVKNGHIYGNTVDRSGSNDDSRKWGRGSGLWTWGSEHVLIEHNRFTNANGPGDSAGAHIDFNCSNIVLQYNFSMNNAGGFCEILGNNHNCAYRYNISVNDGHRIKGVDGAFQEGKIFWLSAYSGKDRIGAVNSYFYNNTMYVRDEIQAKVAIDRLSDGVLIANNIFHIEGPAKAVKGDQYNPERESSVNMDRVDFMNNLFLHQNSWPKEQRLQDLRPLFGDAGFRNPEGQELADFTPTNAELIGNRGIQIRPLPGDSIGLLQGLRLERDILGNPIRGLPDLGAIEIQ